MTYDNRQKILTGIIVAFTAIMALALITSNQILAYQVDSDAQVMQKLKQKYPDLPIHAALKQQEIDNALNSDQNWIGMMTWNATSAKIDYLGPSESNPHIVKNEYNGKLLQSGSPFNDAPIIQVVTTKPVNKFDSINKASSSSTTALYKVQQDFPLKWSTTSGVNLYPWLDAKNSNNGSWLQVSAFYDTQGAFGTPAWHVGYDAYATSTCGQYISFPIQSVSMPFGVSDPVSAWIRGDSTAGRYNMGVFDNIALVGTSLTFNISGDSGVNTINLGRTTGGNCVYPSGTQVEEESNNGNKYNFGTFIFDYKFYQTPTSSATTSASGFFGPEGCGANVSAQNSPARTTFTYTGTGC